MMSFAERQCLNQIASRWWRRGPDDGHEVVVTVRLSRPTHRSNDEVLDLFASIAEGLSGGYRSQVSVKEGKGA